MKEKNDYTKEDLLNFFSFGRLAEANGLDFEDYFNNYGDYDRYKLTGYIPPSFPSEKEIIHWMQKMFGALRMDIMDYSASGAYTAIRWLKSRWLPIEIKDAASMADAQKRIEEIEAAIEWYCQFTEGDEIQS